MYWLTPNPRQTLSGPADRLRPRYPQDPEEPLPYFQTDAQRAPYSFTKDSNFSDAYGDAPYAGGPGWEKPEIPGTQPSFFAILMCNEYLAGDHHDGLVLAVMAPEEPGSALPHNNIRGQVVASQYLPGPRHRGAGQNPTGQHGFYPGSAVESGRGCYDYGPTPHLYGR